MFFAKIITKILSSKLSVRLLFGIKVANSIPYQIGFSTILMKKALKKYALKDSHILDIGTGPLAVHAIWIKKNIGSDVVATEISDDYIKNAGKIAAFNECFFVIIKSDLFMNVKNPEGFDLILFNPPVENKEDDLSYVVAKRFVNESPKSKLLIVVNRLYVNFEKIESIITSGNCKITEVVSSFMNPARVYVVEKR